tara:strand:+ start:72 stop:467 length:396 start_codon:yes stop_codon:yes gene_type:complete
MKTLQELIENSNAVKAILANSGIELNDNILIKVYSTSIEMILCEDGTMAKRVFGGDVTVMGHCDFGTNERRIELNVGSMGSFDVNCIASTTKVFTQAAILKNWDVFVLIASALMNVQEAKNQLSMLNSNNN